MPLRPMCSTRRSRSMTTALQVTWPGGVARLHGLPTLSRTDSNPVGALRSPGYRAGYASAVARMWERVGGTSSPRESMEWSKKRGPVGEFTSARISARALVAHVRVPSFSPSGSDEIW